MLTISMVALFRAFGQGSDDIHFAGGGFTMGYAAQNIGPLQALLPNGSPMLSDDQLVMGGMGFGSVGRWVIGGTGYTMMGEIQIHEPYTYYAAGAFGVANLGYIALSSSHVRIVPMFGFGGGGYGMDIIFDQDLTLEEVQDDPGYHLSISNSVLMADIGAHVYIFPQLRTGAGGGFTIGIQTGYTYGITMDEWSHSGGYVSGMDNMDISAPYLNLFFGFTGGWDTP